MKRILLFTAMLMIAFGAFAQYIDLGLPSGTKWKTFNEPGFYTYDEAMSKFASQLPTYDQLGELYSVCDWIWLGDAYKVVGPNGNFMKLPAAGGRSCDGSVDYVGSCGYCWSSTPYGSITAYGLFFYSGKVGINNYPHFDGLSVRLVQN